MKVLIQTTGGFKVVWKEMWAYRGANAGMYVWGYSCYIYVEGIKLKMQCSQCKENNKNISDNLEKVSMDLQH